MVPRFGFRGNHRSSQSCRGAAGGGRRSQLRVGTWERRTRPADAAPLWAGATGRGQTPGPCALRTPPPTQGPLTASGAGPAGRNSFPLWEAGPDTSVPDVPLDLCPQGRVAVWESACTHGQRGRSRPPATPRAWAHGPTRRLRVQEEEGDPGRPPPRERGGGRRARPGTTTLDSRRAGLTPGPETRLDQHQLHGLMRRHGWALQGRAREPHPQAPPTPPPEASTGRRCSGVARNVTNLPVTTPR